MIQTYRAISLWQPWATLIAIQAKRFETRSWATPYRGLLAIHAAKREPVRLDAALAPLYVAGYNRWSDLPLGAVVCIVRLVDVLPTESVDVHGLERSLGDFSPGRFAWQLEVVEVLRPPIPARGRQGLWTWKRSTP